MTRTLLDVLADGPQNVLDIHRKLGLSDWKAWNKLRAAVQFGWVTCDATTAEDMDDWEAVLWSLTDVGRRQHVLDMQTVSANESYYIDPITGEGPWA